MKTFNVNERVMARWPGSALWFEGVVVDLNDIEYQVRFFDEGKSEFIIKYKDVKPVTEFVPRKRSTSRGRSKSRGRGTGRSPSRRAKKEPEIVFDKVVVPLVNAAEPVVEAKVSYNPTPRSKISSDPTSRSKVSSDPTPRSRLARAELLTPRTSTPTRQSLRLGVSKEKNDLDSQVNDVKADTVGSKVADKKTSSSGLASRGCGLTCRVGAGLKAGVCALVPSLTTIKVFLQMVIMLILPFILNESCTKKKCTVLELPSIPRSLQYYYDPLALAMVGGFLAMQLLLYFIPLGRIVKIRSGGTVRCNGWIAMVMSLAILPLLMHLEYNVVVVYSKYRHLLATSVALGVVVSVAAYVRAAYISADAKNPMGNSRRLLPDFFTGRETAPIIGRLNLKFFLFRVTCIALILLNVVFIVKDLQTNPGKYSPTLLVACCLQILYAADWVWFEETYFTTYDYTRQGFGLFLILGSFSSIFTLPIFTRLILNHRTELEWYYLALITSLNLLGYTITRGANSQKNAFRTNPSDPALAHLESLPTAAGTRLLVSGWWGFVRHPNYLGDVFVFTSWALLCGFHHALPWLLVAMDVLFLIGRTYEVEAACKKKYGSLWDSYTSRVPSRLIPKVF